MEKEERNTRNSNAESLESRKTLVNESIQSDMPPTRFILNDIHKNNKILKQKYLK